MLFDIAVNVTFITLGISSNGNNPEVNQTAGCHRNPVISVTENFSQDHQISRFGVDVDDKSLEKFSRYA
ncbi:hypothetical protein [uncultured Gimesia sp.]|uniref:hypothetical protein n=1 Tax=uncultured Gimesia sp. TaxID=1678688 RepID=UPI002610F37C|nr:hypothetical protein [uncultured Gimesia sp.]